MRRPGIGQERIRYARADRNQVVAWIRRRRWHGIPGCFRGALSFDDRVVLTLFFRCFSVETETFVFVFLRAPYSHPAFLGVDGARAKFSSCDDRSRVTFLIEVFSHFCEV